MMSSGILARKILLITKVNTMLGPTTRPSTPGIHMKKFLLGITSGSAT
jgi:hypothetical protein